jgi:hypothetical protein
MPLDSEVELQTSLAAWKRRLKREQAIITRHVRARRRVKAMIARRKRQLQQLGATKTRGDRAVMAALKDASAGVHEKPNGSNWGGRVATMLRGTGLGPNPWCGAAVITWLRQGGYRLQSNRGVYVPNIVADAKAGQNGWAKWIPVNRAEDAPVGAAVVMDFGNSAVSGEHVGILRKKVGRGAATIPTVEGNTSPGSRGSQDNGQGVYVRDRPRAQVVGFAVAA